jgi:type IV secretory pathway component VirB8
MLNTWKNNKVKRHKKRMLISFVTIGVIILIALIVVVCLLATKVI